MQVRRAIPGNSNLLLNPILLGADTFQWPTTTTYDVSLCHAFWIGIVCLVSLVCYYKKHFFSGSEMVSALKANHVNWCLIKTKLFISTMIFQIWFPKQRLYCRTMHNQCILLKLAFNTENKLLDCQCITLYFPILHNIYRRIMVGHVSKCMWGLVLSVFIFLKFSTLYFVLLWKPSFCFFVSAYTCPWKFIGVFRWHALYYIQPETTEFLLCFFFLIAATK